MKMRPILFSAPMVRAILDGTKTQTRRVVKPQFEPDAEPVEMSAISERGYQISGHSGYWWDDVTANSGVPIRCPYGQPGDRLWLRETFLGWYNTADSSFSHAAAYRADGYELKHGEKWRPSIHMPRSASRISLEITRVRVERLQAINEVDAIAEGAPWAACGLPQEGSHKAGYAQLWESINGTGSWDVNPWVWVVEFKRVETGDA